MEVASPIPKHSVGKTFVVAIALLGIIALAQLGAILWVVLSRENIGPMATVATADSAVPDEDFAADPLPGPAAPALAPSRQIAGLATPTPVPAGGRQGSAAQARATELVEQSKVLRDRGDTSTAITRLREAVALVPNDPLIISELALAYEKMGLGDRAAEQWRHIYESAEAGSVYHTLAETKLHQGASGPPASTAAVTSEIQPGSMLGIDAVEKIEKTDPAASKKFVVRLRLRARPDADIDVRDVVIQVFFYDMLDGRDIVQTNAHVRSDWTTWPADWRDDHTEVLEVEYLQPAQAAEEAGGEDRKYYGFVVRLYYKNELQDMRADPVTLLKDFPPPLTLQSDDQS